MLDIVETDPGTLDQTIYQHIVGVISKVAREPNMAADQLSNISSQYAYYYGIMIRAKRLLDDAEEAIESFKAASRTKKREEGGKLTAVAGEDYVNSLQETLDLNNEVNRLRESYGRQESKLFQ